MIILSLSQNFFIGLEKNYNMEENKTKFSHKLTKNTNIRNMLQYDMTNFNVRTDSNFGLPLIL